MGKELRHFLRLSYRQGRRLVVLMIGSTIMLAGAAMLVLPGPGLVVIPLGLAILAIEFAWARRWLGRLKEKFNDVEQRVSDRMRNDRKRDDASPPD